MGASGPTVHIFFFSKPMVGFNLQLSRHNVDHNVVENYPVEALLTLTYMAKAVSNNVKQSRVSNDMKQSRVWCRSTPPEGGGHQTQFPSPCCFAPLYSARQHWDEEGGT